MIPDESARGPRGHGLISALMVDGRVCNGQGERRGGGFIGGKNAAVLGRHRRGALWGVEDGTERAVGVPTVISHWRRRHAFRAHLQMARVGRWSFGHASSSSARDGTRRAVTAFSLRARCSRSIQAFGPTVDFASRDARRPACGHPARFRWVARSRTLGHARRAQTRFITDLSATLNDHDFPLNSQ